MKINKLSTQLANIILAIEETQNQKYSIHPDPKDFQGQHLSFLALDSISQSMIYPLMEITSFLIINHQEKEPSCMVEDIVSYK